MTVYKSKSQAYTILITFIVIIILSYILSSNNIIIYSIIGMASVPFILEIGRLRENSRKLLIFTIALTIFFIIFGAEYLKFFSLAIVLSLTPSFQTHKIRHLNNLKFENIKNQLDTTQKEIISDYKSARRKIKRLNDEINRFSKLYDLSKEIEKVTNSEELAEKALESLHLKFNTNKLAFYKSISSEYRILKLKNVTPKTANKWLEYIINETTPSEINLSTFDLKAGTKKLGLIICKGKLNEKQIKEAQVLISQIVLGYEKTTLYERVKELSRIDGLTGLYLRMYFLERLSEEIKRAQRENYKIAFIMADLDNFKNYNDTHGHPMGDKLLRKVSSIIKDNIYSSDFAGRYGGEEFCIYMPMAEPKGTIKKAEKIWKLIEKETPLTISMGISYFPNNGNNPEELIKAADSALYYAKEHGKNQIHQL